MSIPKKIHYCWFGNNPLPEMVVKCIESWKKNLPDYEIIEWNERNFHINTSKYVQEAYDSKKYAFVSDYVRLYALYNHGGIYFDTDVEVIKSFDDFLWHEGFSGFENKTHVTTGILAAQKKSEFIKEFLSYYDNRNFVLSDGTLDLTTNVEVFTKICIKHGLITNNKYQVINGFGIYPQTYFSPLSDKSKKKYFSENTHAIHYFAGTWLSEEQKRRKNSFSWILLAFTLRLIKKIIILIVGENKFHVIKRKIKERNFF